MVGCVVGGSGEQEAARSVGREEVGGGRRPTGCGGCLCVYAFNSRTGLRAHVSACHDASVVP